MMRMMVIMFMIMVMVMMIVAMLMLMVMMIVIVVMPMVMIIPGFLFSSLAIYIVSKMDAPPSEEITSVFDEVEKSGI